VRLEPTVERFVDLRHGPQEQRPSEQCGDLLVRDRDGNWTYQFAAAVDDLAQGVTLVIRGVDLLASTGRQIQLARLLGRAEPPAFLHHGLIMKSVDQKLSKSDGDTGIRELRARGWTPADVIARALSRVRWTEATEVTEITGGTEKRRRAERMTNGDSCGRARNAGWLTKNAAAAQARRSRWLVTATAVFVSVTAGFASRRPHSALRSSPFLCSSCELGFLRNLRPRFLRNLRPRFLRN
jgi:glutamyl/glutaminyl-tRNA synthetase